MKETTPWLFAIAAVTTLSSGARADFSGTPVVVKADGGWSWFQDPRAIITNNQLVVGAVAGTAGSGTGNALGDVSVTSLNLNTQAVSTPFVLANFTDHDDHDVPAFAVLPDGRLLTTYENHGGTNNVLWRVSSAAGDATSWGAQQTSAMNPVADGNGNTYNNPFYLSTPNLVFNSSRSIGYDPNYATFTNLNNATPTFTYGGHWMYWQNPSSGQGNGRPYVKYASNGTDTVWFANTEDSPDNYNNSLYVGYIKFNAAGAATVYTSTGTALGGLSTGTAPTGSANPGGTGNVASGTGFSYPPTAFTTVLKANGTANGVNLTGKAVSWASSMRLDSAGNPYIGIVVRDNLNDAAGNDFEYYFAHFNGASWQVSRLGYGGSPLYSGQPNYAGLIALDPTDPNKLFISANVDPVTDAALAHYQIFEGISPDGCTTWTWTQLTNSASVDNMRPIVASGNGKEALLWMQGTYASYTSYNTNIVALIADVPEPGTLGLAALGCAATLVTSGRRRRRSPTTRS